MITLRYLTLAVAITLAGVASAEDFSKETVERGRYIATASDCVACHTNHHGGKPMAGGLEITSPVGTIISTNITPSKEFGIGRYTEAQFADAVRKGIRADDANLYPAMPYVSYSLMTDEDIHALYAYFMTAVAPVDEKTTETSLPFPMNIRSSLMGWNLLFRPNQTFSNDPSQSAEWNRGRYLAEGAAHCSTCHTPRGFLMQEKTALNLTGSQVGPWYAPNITNDKVNGIGSWTHENLVAYLKTGRLDHRAQAAGSMAEAISFSLQHLTDEDLSAIATYVQSVSSSEHSKEETGKTRFDQGGPANALAGFRGTNYKQGMDGPGAGAQIYSANCASCHGVNAEGTGDGYYPSLFKNAATGEKNATNLIATILYGVDRKTKDGHAFMPPFGDQPNALTSLSNKDVSALSNYILGQFGNSDVSVSPDDVRVVRAGGPASNLVTFARGGIAAGALALLGLTFAGFFIAKRRSQ